MCALVLSVFSQVKVRRELLTCSLRAGDHKGGIQVQAARAHNRLP